MGRKLFLIAFCALFLVKTVYPAVSIDDVLNTIKKTALYNIQQDFWNLSTSDVKIKIENENRLKEVPKDTDYYEFDIGENKSILGLTIQQLVCYNKNQDIIKRIPIHLRIKAYQMFVISKDIILKGDLITSKNITASYMDIYGKPRHSISNISDVQGKEAKLTIGRRVIITERMIQSPSIVKKGDQIWILLNKSGVELRVKGVALEDGRIGKQMRVKTVLKSQKIVKGELIDSSTIKATYLY